MSQQTHDLAFNLAIGPSLPPAARVAATATGTFIDCSGLIGPVQALCVTGAATGAPTTTSVTYSLVESDAANGAGATAITDATATVIHVGADADFIAGQRSKRYAAVVAVVAFTGGTTPTALTAGTLLNPRIRSA